MEKQGIVAAVLCAKFRMIGISELVAVYGRLHLIKKRGGGSCNIVTDDPSFQKDPSLPNDNDNDYNHFEIMLTGWQYSCHAFWKFSKL